jgi:urease accessory protein
VWDLQSMARAAVLESQFRDTGVQLPNGGDSKDAEGPSKYGGEDINNDLHISNHIFYLLTDSALPLGSFAYSSGLESFQEHHKRVQQQSEPGKESRSANQMALLDKFLCLSIEAVAFANMPYLLSAFRNPAALRMLDNDLDASTPCQVASRASRAQGGALLMLWKKSLASAPLPQSAQCLKGAKALNDFASNLATCYGHFAPLWGVICLATGQSIEQAAYVFLLNHARAVLSAALRTKASVIGQFHQYAVLGGAHLLPGGQTLHQLVRGCLAKVWNLGPEDACQVVPSMDLWIGRHDLLYTRVFNS